MYIIHANYPRHAMRRLKVGDLSSETISEDTYLCWMSECEFPPTIIPLFGILSPLAEQEEKCHFCLETITKAQFMVFNLPCCGHLTHAECFKTWASTSQKESIVRCAYCRTAYPYEDTCFLCLQEYTEKLNCTKCCHTKVHAECTADLTVLLSLLTYKHTLECGQLADCNRL